MLPNDWDVRSLAHIATIRSGIAKNSNASVSDPVLVHYLRVANVQKGFLDLSEMSQIRISRADINRYAVLPGDMLMNEGGDLDQLGRGSVWHGEFEPCVHQNHVFVVRCGAKLSPGYLNVWTSSEAARRYFMVAGKQTTNLASINKKALGQLPVALPSLAEQQAIDVALSHADGLIDSLEQLLVKKRQIKQGAIQDLLGGKKRLPGFSGPWDIRELRDVCVKIQDGTHFSPKLGGSDFLYVTSKNIGFGVLDVSTAGRISADQHAKIYARCDVTKGDLLLTKDGVNAGNAALNTLDDPISLLSSVAMLRFDRHRHTAAYFLYQILSPDGQQQVKELVSGNAITRLTLLKIRLLRFPVATLAEQTAIAAVLSDMDAELVVLAAKLAKARQLKLGMMQELLTGRIRLV